MANNGALDRVTVVVIYNSKSHSLDCEACMTMAQIRSAWHAKIEASPSVSFFTPDNSHLSDSCTISEAVLGSTTPQVLILKAVARSTYWLRIFGQEDSITPFEVFESLTPTAVRECIKTAVGISTDEYRLLREGVILDLEQSFQAQGLIEGSTLTVDLQLTVNIDLEQSGGVERRTVTCFGSHIVGELRKELGLDDSTVLVAISHFRQVLSNPLHLCHIVSDVMDLHVPLHLIAERKVTLSFEPITFPHRRQQVAVALSSTPLDLYEILGSLFKMNTEFQLAVTGKPLEKFTPLIEQYIDDSTVIQLDVLRTCKVDDQWADLRERRCDNQMLLYSTESSHGLFLRNFFHNEQQLMYDGINLTIFGSMLDIFGAITGEHKCLLLVDRDVERSLPVLLFDFMMRKRAWARTLMLDVVPISQGLRPKEIMCHGDVVAGKKSLKQLFLSGDSLVALDPLKVVVGSDRKMRVHRFARGSIHGDVLARMRQLKGCHDLGLRNRDCPIEGEQINSKIDVEMYVLASENRFKTKLTVSLNGKGFGCWFLEDKVRRSDILIKAGKQAKVSPRTLFCRTLFCVGCGRKISKEEEAFQCVPSDCCRVRSLELTDRPSKEVGVQTAVPRSRDQETYTLWPEERDAATQTDDMVSSRTIQCSLPRRTQATQSSSKRVRRMAPPAPLSAEFCIWWYYDGRDDFLFDLTYDPPLRGRRLRQEIAKMQGVREVEMKLVQGKARRRSDGAALVWSLSGIEFSWLDEKGELVRWRDVEGKHFPEIEDEEEVRLACKQATLIRVEKAAWW